MKKYLYMNADIETVQMDISKIVKSTILIAGIDKISAAWGDFTINGEEKEYELVCGDETVIVKKITSAEDVSDFDKNAKVFILRGNEDVFAEARTRIQMSKRPVILLEEHIEREKDIPVSEKIDVVQTTKESSKELDVVRKGQIVVRIIFVLLVLGIVMIIGSILFACAGGEILWV